MGAPSIQARRRLSAGMSNCVRGTIGPAFSPSFAGPWKWAAVAFPLRPEYVMLQESILSASS